MDEEKPTEALPAFLRKVRTPVLPGEEEEEEEDYDDEREDYSDEEDDDLWYDYQECTARLTPPETMSS